MTSKRENMMPFVVVKILSWLATAILGIIHHHDSGHTLEQDQSDLPTKSIRLRREDKAITLSS
jgi:hypothetical protein